MSLVKFNPFKWKSLFFTVVAWIALMWNYRPDVAVLCMLAAIMYKIEECSDVRDSGK